MPAPRPADPVLVMQAMGRQIGFIPAAARLADPEGEMPLQIYLAESPCSLEQLADQVNDQLRRTRAMPGRGERGIRRRRARRGARFVRPCGVQLQPDDGLPGRGELSESRRAGRQRGRAGQRVGHRSAAFDGVCLDGRSRRSVSQRTDGGPAGRPRRKRIHGDDPPRAGADLSRALRQGAARARSPTASGLFRRRGSRPTAAT